MKSISKILLLSAVGLYVESGNLAYASFEAASFHLKSGIPTLHTHHKYIRHTQEILNLSSHLFDKGTDKGVKIASVCFITDAGNCSGDKFGNLESPTGGSGGGTPNGNGEGNFDENGEEVDDNIPEYETIPEQCRNAGYTVTSCVAGKHPVNPCPSDNTYYKECVCDENLTQTCSVPYYGVGVSCDGKYASCQRDDDKACRNAGYTQTAACPTLQVPNKKCPYNASYYDKCVCQSGLVTCTSPQIGVGTSCGGKYQSCQCPSAYKSCDCGGAVGATSCTINGQTTYSSCKICCDNSCPSGYSLTKPGGCYAASQNDCGNTCYKSQECCDNRCENHKNISCYSGENKRANGQDGCGNICYECCYTVQEYIEYGNGCSCVENGDGSCTLYYNYTRNYSWGGSESYSDTSTHSDCSACERASYYINCTGSYIQNTTTCNGIATSNSDYFN